IDAQPAVAQEWRGMSRHPYRQRQLANTAAMLLGSLAAMLGVAMLGWILWTTISRGIEAIGMPLFTRNTVHAAEGGLANAMVGSLLMDLMAIAMCAPVGVMSGTWLAEYAGRSRLGSCIRFLNDILLSAPSIVLGLFVYMVVVLPMP